MTINELLETTEMHHPTAFADAFLEFLIDREEAAPADIRDQIKGCTNFSLKEMGVLIELVYARRADCGPILMQLVGKLAEFYDARNYLGMRGRGGAINSVLRACAEVDGAAMPSAENTPEPKPEYVPEPEPEEE